ncbi:hypothetical protein F2P79_015793 [Pimephales promelas]|nr:hypothetical protein F2P79_015793 [Pimephales promelas]
MSLALAVLGLADWAHHCNAERRSCLRIDTEALITHRSHRCGRAPGERDARGSDVQGYIWVIWKKKKKEEEEDLLKMR